jgi:hypothetical protein
MRLIVCGTRTFTDRDLLFRKLDAFTAKLDKKKLTIIHGGAKGADTLANDWAFHRMVHMLVFHADWDKHGKAAGPMRNKEMINAEPDALVAFWDGKSPGTRSMIALAYQAKLKVKVVRYKP